MGRVVTNSAPEGPNLFAPKGRLKRIFPLTRS
jgi:hypothetical protein